MKITPTTVLPLQREPAKPANLRATALPQANDSVQPSKTSASGGQKTVPPGLERALARLQSLPAPNAGQTNATDHIGRNLARYAETQAIGAAPAAPSSVSDDVTSAPVPASDTVMGTDAPTEHPVLTA